MWHTTRNLDGENVCNGIIGLSLYDYDCGSDFYYAKKDDFIFFRFTIKNQQDSRTDCEYDSRTTAKIMLLY